MAWHGLNDVKTENKWVWADGNVANKYTKWGKGEPNGKRRENCVVIRTYDQGWADYSCNSLFPFFCQISKLILGISK